ncbi:MAG: antibiotic biosynthesis monooxygenase [Coriobacteriales bacterium]|nr:antibiotic biosynthesis monooxygenase [Coriobacteriales bacterium]
MSITRLFRLVAVPTELDRFASVGEHNLVTSLETEPGTLSMSATHLPDDATVNFVFEIYADQAAYEVHAASPQFGAFAALAGEVLTDRAVYACTPQLLLDKPEGLCVKGANEVAPRLARVVVPAENDAAFRTAVFANMRASVEKEPGVLAMYAVTLADDPETWYFWEIYASEQAYAAHRETEHFKAYIAATADLTSDKELTPLAADTLVFQGGLNEER